MTSQPPDREALAMIRNRASNLTERQLRRVLVQSKSFEDWVVQIYETALRKKRAVEKRRQANEQRRRQSDAKRDSLGRYAA